MTNAKPSRQAAAPGGGAQLGPRQLGQRARQVLPRAVLGQVPRVPEGQAGPAAQPQPGVIGPGQGGHAGNRARDRPRELSDRSDHETTRNETTRNDTTRNETKRNETKRNETKRHETTRNDTKRNETFVARTDGWMDGGDAARWW